MTTPEMSLEDLHSLHAQLKKLLRVAESAVPNMKQQALVHALSTSLYEATVGKFQVTGVLQILERAIGILAVQEAAKDHVKEKEKES